MALLRNLRSWFSTPHRRLGGAAALAVLVLGGLSGGLAVALSGGDDESPPAAQVAANASDTPGTAAGTGTPAAEGTSTPGGTSGTTPGTAAARGTRTPRPGGTPSRQQATGEKPSLTIPTIPPGLSNLTPTASMPQETATVKPPTPTPTPRTLNFVSPVTPPPPSGRNYCSSTSEHPPGARVAGALLINGADAPAGTEVRLGFDGTVGPAKATEVVGGYGLDVWSGGGDCANRAGAAIYVVVNGQWFPTGRTIGNDGAPIELIVVDIQL
jgi:hypothetical protein